MEYTDFASKISFFEFIQEEFKEPQFKIKDYAEEIDLLNDTLNIDKLIKILESNPTTVDIFEQVFQLDRFTNTQFIHFCFDVNVFNNSDHGTIVNYIKNSVFKFENGKDNKIFMNIYSKLHINKPTDNVTAVFLAKRTINEYVGKCLKDRNVFHNHIKNSIASRLRIARYLVENLRVDEYFQAINLTIFLKIKRKPIDTKSIHGNFGIIKIKKIFEENGLENVDNIIFKAQGKQLPINIPCLPEIYGNRFCYSTENIIEGILKRKTQTPKKFDFVIFYDRKPVIAIETNFFSSFSGTKIGINREEYTNLAEDVEALNRKFGKNLKFIWITDGNFWLTNNGEKEFRNLKTRYFKQDYNILNYNLLKENLSSILNYIKNENKA